MRRSTQTLFSVALLAIDILKRTSLREENIRISVSCFLMFSRVEVVRACCFQLPLLEDHHDCDPHQCFVHWHRAALSSPELRLSQSHISNS